MLRWPARILIALFKNVFSARGKNDINQSRFDSGIPEANRDLGRYLWRPKCKSQKSKFGGQFCQVPGLESRPIVPFPPLSFVLVLALFRPDPWPPTPGPCSHDAVKNRASVPPGPIFRRIGRKHRGQWPA